MFVKVGKPEFKQTSKQHITAYMCWNRIFFFSCFLLNFAVSCGVGFLGFYPQFFVSFGIVHAKSLHLCLTLVILWTVACQAPLSIGFFRQEYWNGLPCPPSGDVPDPGIEPASLLSPALAGRFFTTSTTWEAHFIKQMQQNVDLTSRVMST